MRLNFTRPFENMRREIRRKIGSSYTGAGRVKKREKSSRWSMLELRDLMRPVGEHNLMQPACPICSRPLRLSRVTPRDGELSELRTYGCTGCGVWLTEAADDGSD
jgi:hypothetical protein